MPNTCELIPFEGDTCVLCKTLETAPQAMADPIEKERLLNEQIEQIREKGQGRPYDCVVGVSGGRDSTYLLYLLTQKHRLRCLAVYYRTPFTHDVVDGNIRRIVQYLGADFEEIQLSQEYHRRIAREMIEIWKKNRHHLIINLACAPCKLLNRETYQIAKRRGVSTIVYGGNIYEAVQIAAGVSKKQVIGKSGRKIINLTSKIRKMLALIWNGTKLLVTTPAVWKYLVLGVKSSIMYISPHALYLALRYPHIKAIDYYYGATWSEKECEETLEKLGWQRPPGCNSSWKADCCFAEIKNVLFKKTLGITYADAFFSNMVRAGVMTRDEALRRFQTEGKLSPERLKETRDILGLHEPLFEGDELG
ncbi:MAG: hypothetical protein GXY44_08200 [Phycisphaerales bacterium]|nr:hypothetical protein [Phycisphaerales bacterium]